MKIPGIVRVFNALSICCSLIAAACTIAALKSVWKELVVDGQVVAQTSMQSVDVVAAGYDSLPTGSYSWSTFDDLVCAMALGDDDDFCNQTDAAVIMFDIAYPLLIAAVLVHCVAIFMGLLTWQFNACSRTRQRLIYAGWTTAIVGKFPAVAAVFSVFGVSGVNDGSLSNLAVKVSAASYSVNDETGYQALIAATVFAVAAVLFNLIMMVFERFGITAPAVRPPGYVEQQERDAQNLRTGTPTGAYTQIPVAQAAVVPQQAPPPYPSMQAPPPYPSTQAPPPYGHPPPYNASAGYAPPPPQTKY